MGAFDILYNDMACLNCLKKSQNGLGRCGVIQTKITKKPYLNEYKIGDLIDVEWGCSIYNHVTLACPSNYDFVVLLETWTCPFCGTFNWAKVEIQNNHIVSICTVPLVPENIQGVNYIDEEYKYLPYINQNTLSTIKSLSENALRHIYSLENQSPC